MYGRDYFPTFVIQFKTDNIMKKKLDNFRCEVKEVICQILTDIYKKHNNGLLPNWENDEEIVVEDSELGRTMRIGVIMGSYNEDYHSIEKWAINEYRVTLDYNLVFWCGENNDEFDWTSLTTDELVMICDYLQKYWEKIKP